MSTILAIGSKCETHNLDDTVILLDIRPSVGVLVGDIRDMNMFEDNTFSRIEVFHVLEHLWPNEVIGALLELKRVLEPGGLLEVSVPNILACAATLLTGNREILHNIYGTFEAVPFTDHKFGYTPELFESILNDVGFSKVERVTEHDMHEMVWNCWK